ncbi:Retrovirus-related Pol polyprotein from transposon opus, partial [Mucuna pruriens]
MVAKSAQDEQHCEVLTRIFDVLRKHKLKLNLEKCSFGVQARKFLGYLLTIRGIKANPNKCEVIINMWSPRSVKEAKSLHYYNFCPDRLRRLSRSSNPLEGVEDFNRQRPFQELKAMLESSLILSRLREGMPIIVYLSISNEAISTALIQEDKKNQHLIYFISRVLQGAETMYQRLEKVAIGLVVTAQKLGPYFQSNQIERDVKAQILEDFIAELTPNQRGQMTFQGIDVKASGVGIVLEGLDGVLIEQSLLLEFKASNNQAENETLLAEMRLVEEIGAQVRTTKSDFQLVTDQMNGESQARDP